MFKKVFVALTLAICFTGLTLSTGCSGPGEVVEGKKDVKMGKSGDKDAHGNEAPEGTGYVD